MLKIEALESRRLLNAAAGTQFQVDNDTHFHNDPAVAMDAAGDYVVAWDTYDHSSNSSDVFIQRFDAQGNRLGGEVQVNDTAAGTEFAPAIAMNASGSFVVVWLDNAQGPSNIYARQFNADGAAKGSNFLVNQSPANSETAPVVAINQTGEFQAVWRTGFNLNSRLFDSTGMPIEDEFPLTSADLHHEYLTPAISAAGNEFVATWSQWADTTEELFIFAQRYDFSGNTIGDLVTVDSRVPNSISLIPMAHPLSIDADAAGDFVIGWMTDADTTDAKVFYRTFDSTGSPSSATTRVNDTGSQVVRSVGVGFDQLGGFAVTWDSESGILQRQYEMYKGQLLPTADQSFVDNVPSESDEVPALAANQHGSFVIVWQNGIDLAGQSTDVIAKQYHYVAPPTVLSAQFDYQTAQQAKIQFSENVSAGLNINAFVFLNPQNNQAIALPAGSAVSYDAATNTATITFGHSILPDGNYQLAALADGITDSVGNHLDGDNNTIPGGDYDLSFFVLAGDANHDGTVDVTDLGILAGNWQKSGRNFTTGDFNYDGTVDVTDLGILAGNWQHAVSPPLQNNSLAATRRAPVRVVNVVLPA